MLSKISTLGFTLGAFARPAFGRAHMEAYQLEKFRGLLRHALDTKPLYRELYRDCDLSPDQIRTRADLARLPVLSKQKMRELGHGLAGREGLFEHRTSGSTGVPTRVFRTQPEERRLNMIHWRANVRRGLRPGSRLAMVKTVWETLPDKHERIGRLASRFGLVERRVLDCLRPPRDLLRELLDYQPDFLAGYANTLVGIAREYAGSTERFTRLKQVQPGAEYLSPRARRILEDTFSVPVREGYGLTECNLAAWQGLGCDAFHVNDDSVLLEVCRDGVPVSPGEEGDVLISVLHSRCMPLVRYETGDRAVRGEESCSCGEPFSTINSLRGRQMEYLKMPNGEPLHPLQLINEVILAGYTWIARYQMVQEAPDRFRLEVVPDGPVGEVEERALANAVSEELAEGVELRFKWVDEIPADENGKYRFCRTLV